MIRLSRLTDYAVTLLTQMVSEGKGVWAASDLAARSGVPLPTVSKVLKQLAKAGILTAQRGASGGYSLTRPVAAISVAAIVEALEGPIAITDCADGSDHDCRIQSVCPMSGGWNKVNHAVRQALETISLADMGKASL
ncbi:MAG: SUF system Fe-S cluster assembly regulator [Alphaproteobacteria bacterium]|nr:SUF system Fe-S cluster assembly regulator [Alphaproteobacteria bacterium]